MGMGLTLFSGTACAQENPRNLPEGMYAEIKTSRTVDGNDTIVVELEYQKVPLTVANFVGLAEGTLENTRGEETRYYDGLSFHRVIDNFMIQGGDPLGTVPVAPATNSPMSSIQRYATTARDTLYGQLRSK